jgi:opacity protein-like surface antigen
MMKRSLIALTLLVTFMAGAQAAQADEAPTPDRPGLDLAVRTGYALPFGRITTADGGALSDGITGAVPVVLDVMYRANQELSLGLLFQYAFAQVKTGSTGCGTGADCSSSDIHLAIQGIYRPPVGGSFSPWLGLGTGYEWFNYSASVAGISVNGTFSGFEFLILQAGGEVQLAPQFSLGPFLMFSLGQYRSEDVSGALTMSGDISNKALHEWVEFGVRGTFSL